MQNIDRDLLQKIVNDSGSTEEERAEAQRQLAEADAVTQVDQDRLILRFLNRQVETEEYVRLPEAVRDIFHALTYWPLGIDDKLIDYVDALVGLHSRTQSAELKARCRESIEHWKKLALLYRRPGYDKAIRRASQFLESFPERTNHEQ